MGKDISSGISKTTLLTSPMPSPMPLMNHILSYNHFPHAEPFFTQSHFKIYISHLIHKNVNYIFIPSFINIQSSFDILATFPDDLKMEIENNLIKFVNENRLESTFEEYFERKLYGVSNDVNNVNQMSLDNESNESISPGLVDQKKSIHSRKRKRIENNILNTDLSANQIGKLQKSRHEIHESSQDAVPHNKQNFVHEHSIKKVEINQDTLEESRDTFDLSVNSLDLSSETFLNLLDCYWFKRYLEIVRIYLLKRFTPTNQTLQQLFSYHKFGRPEISSGCKIIDESDVFSYGHITHIFGAPGTGKTQFCHSIVTRYCASNCHSRFGNAIYIDSTLSYSQHRLKQIYSSFKKNSGAIPFEAMLQKLKVHRLSYFDEFIQYLDRITYYLSKGNSIPMKQHGKVTFYSNLGLLVIDSLALIILTAVSKKISMESLIRITFQRLREIASYGVCIIFTNFTVTTDEAIEHPKPALGFALSSISTRNMELIKRQEDHRLFRLARFNSGIIINHQTQFEISTRGIKNPSRTLNHDESSMQTQDWNSGA